ncbi:MAG: GAF domain-containing protein [Chloroflexi bacterium]|nr:GAF domain-containing protein [Chloroflexota bacterium]
MDAQTLKTIYTLSQIAVQTKDWKDALDTLIASLREQFVFDNLAIYTIDGSGRAAEVAYARAVGRGQSAEADAAWGEDIAGQALADNEIVVRTPQSGDKDSNRIAQAYLIGLPLNTADGTIGALVFVRFGGPAYTEEQIRLASLTATMVAYIFEKQSWQENLAQLEAVQRQMRLQEDFVATISHELRTPLGFIKGYSTTLLREDTTWDEATQREFLTIIDEETDRLTELIENLLESARLQSETLEMNFQPLRIDALVRDVATRVRARHKTLDVEIDSESSALIHGDSTRLAQVFENLFSNAIKYAPDSSITITLRRANDHMEIVFADQGPGIPPEHLPYIFDRFYRVPGQPGRTGTGLGLFICKRIIQAHHGKIWAESDHQKGSVFFIELPIK